ncbi:hypothetical protein SARC_08783 [Sphaeroforma arctica JP610]|uniref:Uncharacterized protein n=1 Tax=Sphaeroforma arctica JP610 TaxID=667725 RepID=A0A0L0FS41_9EUKA|nr:hypothetical protein SARC_08783 [Sphaeroforma arctica JP610]KNC78793.1 hypothetical protein SARC_08783 [Sphaeroforma arctica JP610]|eukprot:XP_014152695.1 hypothetical protein SARC_08783 [Sphaeroforma arctica JP610]
MSASAVVPFSPDILWSPLYGAPVDAVPQARSSMRGTPRHVTTPSNLMEKLCAANRVSESTSKSNEVLSAQTATPCKVPCTPTRPKVNAPMVSKETPARANEG